ncbi:MAG: tetratricopeptide repeat protein [Bryobacterales bacterium]
MAALLFAVAAPAQEAKAAPETRGDAYYHFSLAHLYRQLALQFVRQEYVTKAIDEFQLAIKADPQSTYLRRELIQLYASVNRLDDAVAEANKVLADDPNNFEMHQLLGRIYQSYSRDRQNGLNESMLNSALAEYEKALEIRPDDFDSLVQISTLYRASGQPDKAKASLEKALEEQPSSAEALTALAALHLDSGDTEKGVELLEKVLHSGDADPRVIRMLGAAYEQAGRAGDAAGMYEQLLEDVEGEGGNTLPIRRELARNLLMSNNLDAAEEQYEMLLEAEPRTAEYHLRLSQIDREKRRFSQAWDHLKQALELEPESLDIKYNGVLLAQAEGKDDDAIARLKAILDETKQANYEPRERANRVMFLEHLGSLYRQKEDFDAAIDVYNQIGEINPEAMSRVKALIVDAYRANRDYEKALAESKAALDEFPDDRALKMQRATLLAEQGEALEGAKLLRTELDGEKSDLEIYLTLIQVYEKGKMFDEGIAAAEEATKLAEGERAQLAVQFAYASILERAKRFDEAEAKFRSLLDRDPENAGALNYLGYMLADRNVKLDEAHDMVQKALDLEPENGAYLDSLGWVYYRQDKLRLAERYLTRSLEQYGRDPVVHTHLGDVYFKMGDNEQARKHWEKSLEEWRKSAVADQDRTEMAKLEQKLEKLGVKVSKADEDAKKSKQ